MYAELGRITGRRTVYSDIDTMMIEVIVVRIAIVLLMIHRYAASPTTNSISASCKNTGRVPMISGT